MLFTGMPTPDETSNWINLSFWQLSKLLVLINLASILKITLLAAAGWIIYRFSRHRPWHVTTSSPRVKGASARG